MRTARPSAPGSRRMLSAKVRETAGRISRANRSASATRASSRVLRGSIGAPVTTVRLLGTVRRYPRVAPMPPIASVVRIPRRVPRRPAERAPSTAKRRGSRGSCRARWPFRSTPTTSSTLVRWAAETNVPLIPRGSGSSMAGGAIGDGVIVDLSRLDDVRCAERRIAHHPLRAGRAARRGGSRGARGRAPVPRRSVERRVLHGGRNGVDERGGCAHAALRLDAAVGRGARLRVRRRLARRASTRRAGAATSRSCARALDALGAGDRRGARVAVATRRRPEGVVGLRTRATSPSRASWSISSSGSEGTLALVVGLELRLAPLRPHTASVLGAFATLEAAVVAARTARDAWAPSRARLLDRTFLDVARRGGAPVPTPEDAESVLLAEVEADTPEEATAMARAIESEFRAAGATAITLALDPPRSVRCGSSVTRRVRSSAVSIRRSSRCSSSRTRCVPPERLAEYVRGVRAALDAPRDPRRDLRPRRRRARAREPARATCGEPDWRVARRRPARRRDGAGRRDSAGRSPASTATVGCARRCCHASGRAESRRAIRGGEARVRSRGHPESRREGRRSRASERSTDVKYDPSLPPLPEPARVALARVERERAYARSRLDAARRSGTDDSTHRRGDV